MANVKISINGSIEVKLNSIEASVEVDDRLVDYMENEEKRDLLMRLVREMNGELTGSIKDQLSSAIKDQLSKS
jgi:hypothetical protein